MKVLLVDDSPMQQKIAKIYLEKGEGYTVITANNGVAGLNKAREEVPDLILLDVEMPELSGDKVLQELKSSEGTKNIPVIMCTANDEFIEEDFIKMGAAGYLKKPHGFSTLKNIVKNIFDKN